MDISTYTITDIQEGYRAGTLSVAEVVSAYVASAKKDNDDINAYLEFFDEYHADEIKCAQKRIDEGTAGSLTGIPFAIKDNILMQGRHASASSKILENYTASYSATVIKKLQEQDVIFIGRTNMDEFAMGSSTETSAYGPTKNPVDTERVPGGSSGGSAASVAMHSVPVALGSDTGGSIRQPASFCNCVGLTPTYGRVSRYGLMALSSSLDVIGPITKTVTDAETVFNVISGEDAMDSTTVKESDIAHVTPGVRRIGVPRDILNLDGVDEEVRDNFEASLKKLADAGYEIVDISLPLAQFALSIYYIIQPAEASSNLARYDGVRFGVRSEGDDIHGTYRASRTEGFGAEVKRRILLGTYVLSHGYYDAYYTKATKLRAKITLMLDESLLDVDVIATPTTPTVPFKFGEKSDDPMAMYMSDLFTVPANIAGLPAISVPSGVNEDGAPFGIQFIGPRYGENRLFTVGKDFESRV